MTVTISRLYDDYGVAKQVVADLQAAGLPAEDISIIVKDEGTRRSATGRVDRDRDGTDDRAEGAGVGAGIGAVLGGAAGALAGLGLIAIPGIGPVVAAGWLAATAVGAAAGGATGGLIGALTQMGVSKEHAHVYAESIRRGATLVSARVPDRDRGRYEAIMDRAAVPIEERAAELRRSGWKEFDENAPPYMPQEPRYERDIHGMDLAEENARLRRLVADLSLEKQQLLEAARNRH